MKIRHMLAAAGLLFLVCLVVAIVIVLKWSGSSDQFSFHWSVSMELPAETGETAAAYATRVQDAKYMLLRWLHQAQSYPKGKSGSWFMKAKESEPKRVLPGYVNRRSVIEITAQRGDEVINETTVQLSTRSEETGERISLSDMFENSTKATNLLYDILGKHITEKKFTGVNKRDYFRNNTYLYSNIAAEPDAILLAFDPGKLVDRAFGCIELRVPLAELAEAGPSPEVWREGADEPSPPRANGARFPERLLSYELYMRLDAIPVTEKADLDKHIARWIENRQENLVWKGERRIRGTGELPDKAGWSLMGGIETGTLPGGYLWMILDTCDEGVRDDDKLPPQRDTVFFVCGEKEGPMGLTHYFEDPEKAGEAISDKMAKYVERRGFTYTAEQDERELMPEDEYNFTNFLPVKDGSILIALNWRQIPGGESPSGFAISAADLKAAKPKAEIWETIRQHMTR